MNLQVVSVPENRVRGKRVIKGETQTQRAQYPLIKEYGLKHNMKPLVI